MYLDVDILLALIKEKDFHREYAKKIISLKKFHFILYFI